MKKYHIPFLVGILMLFSSVLWIVHALPDIGVSGLQGCDYTSVGVAFSGTIGGTGTFVTFSSGGSLPRDADGACSSNLANMVGTSRDGIYFISVGNSDNVMNSGAFIGWPYPVDSEAPIGAFILNANENVDFTASGKYIPGERTFYLDTTTDQPGSLCLPIKLWDRLSGVQDIFVPNSLGIVSMYDDNACGWVSLDADITADGYMFHVPTQQNTIAGVPIDGGERDALYSLKVSWAHSGGPQGILRPTSYPNLVYPKTFSFDAIKIYDVAGNSSFATLLDQ